MLAHRGAGGELVVVAGAGVARWTSVIVAGVALESNEFDAMWRAAHAPEASGRKWKRVGAWQPLLPAPARRMEVGSGPGGALRPAPADAVRYRAKRLAAGVSALVRREDPDDSFARPRLIDAGDRLRAGAGAEEMDRRSMLIMAAERWTVLRLSAGSRVAAAELLQRAQAVGVIDRVGEIHYRGAGGELVVVAGAEVARWANWLKVGGSGMLEPAVLVAVVWGPVPGYTVDRELDGRRIWRRRGDGEGAVRIIDEGARLWLGKDGAGGDVDAMFRTAAQRWTAVRVRVPSRELAQRWLARAAAAGVRVTSVIVAGVALESNEFDAMWRAAHAPEASGRKWKRVGAWQPLLPAPARRMEVGSGPGGALRPAPADAVRYRAKRLAAGVSALVRREDPDDSFARPRLIDAGDRLRAGAGAEEMDRRSMLIMAAERWTVLRLSAGSRVAAAELLQRAQAVGVIDRVGEIHYRGAGGELVVVAGAEVARWVESLAGPAPDPQRPGMGV